MCVLVWITPLAPLFSLRINSLQKKILLDNMINLSKAGVLLVLFGTLESFFFLFDEVSAQWKVGSGC